MNRVNVESAAWHTLYRQMHARSGDLRSLLGSGLVRRIWRFAERHHRRLGPWRIPTTQFDMGNPAAA